MALPEAETMAPLSNGLLERCKKECSFWGNEWLFGMLAHEEEYP